MRVGRIAAMLMLALLVGGGLLLGWRQLQRLMLTPSASASAVRIEVAPGSTLRAVLADLQRRAVLPDARLVELYLRLHRERPRIQAGRYEIAAHATPRQIIQQLAEGRVLLASLTVVEGWSVAQMRQALDSDPDVSHELARLSDAQLMQALGHAGEAAEGRFFPDTYWFAAGTSDRKLLAMAYDRMQRLLQQDWSERAPDLPLQSRAQALTLASIIEKETAVPAERPMVAAVFVNRLRMGMRLQSDPTVIYGLGTRYDGSIHTRDLQTDTPYNTYTRAGLPPTPIALPGAAALRAALHPAPTQALYFVATGEGSHHFSDTLAEQDVALRAYLQHLRQAHAQPAAASGVHGGAAAHSSGSGTHTGGPPTDRS